MDVILEKFLPGVPNPQDALIRVGKDGGLLRYFSSFCFPPLPVDHDD